MFPGAVTQVALDARLLDARGSGGRAARPQARHRAAEGPERSTRPGPDDLYKIGTTVTVVRYLKAPNGVHHLICQGEQRFRTLDYLNGPAVPGRALRLDPRSGRGRRRRRGARRAAEAEGRSRPSSCCRKCRPSSRPALQNIESPGALADMVGGLIDIKPAEKQTILEALKVRDRLDRVIEVLTHRVEVLKLSREIGEQTQGKLDERQREYVLREQLKTIKKELGEDDTQSRARRAAQGDRGREDAGGSREAGAEGAAAPREHARGVDRALDGAHVPRLARRAAVVEERRGSHRHREGARDPRRGPLRPREGQAAHPRVPRGAQAQRGGPQPDPVLRRPARRRQDVARPEHRAGASGSSSCARAWAACTTKPRSAATGAPTSARCRARSFRACARPARTIPCSCSTRWTSSASASTATRRRRCSRCSIPSRTRRSPITISTCRST